LLCELAVAARGRVAAAGVCLDQIPGALRWIRTLTTHPVPEVRDGARAVTARSPLRPDYDLQIRCFGELTVSRSDGIPVSERGRGGRVQQLLAWLLLEAAPSRSALAGSLWPDLTPKQAAANLRVTLASLLDYIEPDREPSSSWFVRTSNGRLQLTDEGVTIDVRTFEHHIDQARVAERSGAPSLALDHFRTAFDHYAGDFLPMLDDTDVVHERLRLQALAYNAGCRVSELLLAKGEPEQALRATACARKIDHLAERAYRTEIRCHLALGALTSARAAARHLLVMLADERLRPDRETEQLLAKVDPS
jgi:DNA-binding SARP family transcriptional activator